jgi:hypothetical protein
MKKPKDEAKQNWRDEFHESPTGKKHLAEQEQGTLLQRWECEAIAAKTVTEHRQALIDSITALHLMALHQGDKEAVMALVECGVQAAHQLHTLHQGHDAESKPSADSPAVIAVNEVAASADDWPVAISAFYEKRKPHLEKTLPQGIGSKLPFRAASLGGSGSARKMGDDTPTDFALWVFEGIECFHNRHDRFQPLSPSWMTGGTSSMGPPRVFGQDYWGEDADKLEPFSQASLPAWVDVAMKFLECECGGNWVSQELNGQLLFTSQSDTWWDYNWPKTIKETAIRYAKQDALQGGHKAYTSADTLNLTTCRAIRDALEERGKSLMIRD